MNTEKEKLIHALFFPMVLLVLMWITRLIEYGFGVDFSQFGIHPLHADGLPGIILAPFIHGGFKHLLANTFPFLILAVALFYFYHDIGLKVLVFIWLMSGIWVWFGGRQAYHIGVSGVIYGLAAFLFLSGVLRKNTQLAALSLIVVFLYGGMIWGIFPEFFPKENISWESHLGGLFAGMVIAIYYRKEGPQRKKYSWELEEDDDMEDENAFWKSNITSWPEKNENDY